MENVKAERLQRWEDNLKITFTAGSVWPYGSVTRMSKLFTD